MPKVYQPPTGTEKSETEQKTGVKKTFGVYDKPVRTSPAMIALLIIAAVIIFFVVLMMMRQ